MRGAITEVVNTYTYKYLKLKTPEILKSIRSFFLLHSKCFRNLKILYSFTERFRFHKMNEKFSPTVYTLSLLFLDKHFFGICPALSK